MIYDLRFTISIVTAVTLVNSVPASEPVEFPKLEACASLWERSLFTTKDLPAPDAPAGPSFADNLSLSGVYELQGEVVALIVDKTTSQVFRWFGCSLRNHRPCRRARRGPARPANPPDARPRRSFRRSLAASECPRRSSRRHPADPHHHA